MDRLLDDASRDVKIPSKPLTREFSLSPLTKFTYASRQNDEHVKPGVSVPTQYIVRDPDMPT